MGGVPYARVDGEESKRYDARSFVADSMPEGVAYSGKAGLSCTDRIDCDRGVAGSFERRFFSLVVFSVDSDGP